MSRPRKSHASLRHETQQPPSSGSSSSVESVTLPVGEKEAIDLADKAAAISSDETGDEAHPSTVYDVAPGSADQIDHYEG